MFWRRSGHHSYDSESLEVHRIVDRGAPDLPGVHIVWGLWGIRHTLLTNVRRTSLAKGDK